MNAVDLEEVDATPPAARPAPGAVLVGYIGQLIQRKNLDCLLTAFGRLAAERPGVALAIVGDGPLRRELEAAVARMGLSGRVRFVGYDANGVGLLKTFDVLVLPSWLEGIPRCVMEAMAARVAVVASDIPGNRMLVQPGETGLLFPPEDPRALERAIASVIEHRELSDRLVCRARALIEREFSSQRMAEQYTDLYQTCSTSSS
jgi:glycosyltransferase involved in cell wall biosynthesis